MNILDMIVLGALIDEFEHDSKKETKKPESENSVDVCIYSDSMIVEFNDVDKDQIQEFIRGLDANPCKYTQEDNGFEISADVKTLYRILLYLTNEFEEIALY